MEEKNDWKLALREGKLKTPYKHFTVLADGLAEEPIEDFGCPKGTAWMAMKTWALSAEESMKLIRFMGHQIGFQVMDDIQVLSSEPENPPAEKPYGYGICFSSYTDDDENDDDECHP